MTNADETRELIRNYILARVPLVVIRSIELTRSIRLVREIASELRQMPFYVHTRVEGLKQLPDNQLVSDDTSLAAAMDQATSLMRRTEYVNFVFTDVEELDEESSTSRHLAELARLAESHAGTIILVSAKTVWSGLSRLGMSATLDLPDSDELFGVLGRMIDDYRGQFEIEWDAGDVRTASDVLAGITETEATNVIATMLASGRLGADDLPKLSEYKDRIFGDLAGLERIRLREDYTVGGLKNLRSWLARRSELVIADFSRTNLRPPKGILLVGVPGCGKSLSAKAIAADWKLPLYRLDMSAILGMYVGQSEGRLREALETADRVAPCVLWIDEIEKALAGSSGDSGTSRRLIGQFLFWLQESTSRVFLVATANDVSSLPPELTRKGRFDEIFFVDLPDAADREEILRMYFTRYLAHDLDSTFCARLVTQTDGFTGAEIDGVVHDIAATAFQEHRTGLYPDHVVMEFFENTVPLSKSSPEDLAAIRAWGATRAVPASTVPKDSGGSEKPGRRIVAT